jgi:hypothetical protein
MRIRGAMSKSRRQFLTNGSLGLLGISVTSCKQEQKPAAPALATTRPVGPEVSPLTFGEAERLVQVELSESDRREAVTNWRSAMAPLYERRVGPRKVALEPALAPWSHGEAALPGQPAGPTRNLFLRSKADPGPLPSNDEDIAFAPVTRLSRWIESKRPSNCQAEHGRPGHERRVVWPADKKSLAARRRIVGFKRGTRISNRRRVGGLFHRQRNRRQHRKPQHALRNYRPAGLSTVVLGAVTVTDPTW